MDKKDLLGLEAEEIEKLVVELGEKKYRGNQIFEWISRGEKSFNAMTNLPEDFRKVLYKNTFVDDLKIEEKLTSNIDGTRKYLFALNDGNIIEGVTMSYRHGFTACISTQVGCLMGCSFCASSKGGFIRNLTSGEMVDQVIKMGQDLNDRISNIVLMGSGEPLHNFNEVIKFIRIVNRQDGLNIGNRHITLSTCGLVPEIKKLAKLQIPINLAISLHAPNDEIRQDLMPIARKYNIKQLIGACQYYLSYNNRRITFEYGLIKGINDQDKHAVELAKLLKDILCHVNLIPINSIEEMDFTKTKEQQIKRFQKILGEKGIVATVRREMGSDIKGACGQLRNRHILDR